MGASKSKVSPAPSAPLFERAEILEHFESVKAEGELAIKRADISKTKFKEAQQVMQAASDQLDKDFGTANLFIDAQNELIEILYPPKLLVDELNFLIENGCPRGGCMAANMADSEAHLRRLPISFGKYKGYSVGKVFDQDKSYVRWVLERKNPQGHLKRLGMWMQNLEIAIASRQD